MKFKLNWASCVVCFVLLAKSGNPMQIPFKSRYFLPTNESSDDFKSLKKNIIVKGFIHPFSGLAYDPGT